MTASSVATAMLQPAHTRHIDHIAVAVADATASATWYEQHLSMSVVHDEVIADKAVRLLYLQPEWAAGPLPVTALQLAQPIGPGAVRDFIDQHGEALHHVCFAVDKLDSDFSFEVGPTFRGGRDRRACFLRDQPNNVLIELTDAEPFYSARPDAAAS